MPDGAALILDNYQEVSLNTIFDQLIAEAVNEVPDGRTMVLVSRHSLPECYARLIANERVQILDWDAIKLTLDEVHLIASARIALDRKLFERLHQRCEGWAAGLILVLEQVRKGSGFNDVDTADSLKNVFDYFAGQLFDQTDPGSQDLLRRMSVLPKMTRTGVAALTGLDLGRRSSSTVTPRCPIASESSTLLSSV